jgi:hypothetical protein
VACVSRSGVGGKIIFDVEWLTIIKSFMHLNTYFEFNSEFNYWYSMEGRCCASQSRKPANNSTKGVLDCL